MSDIVTLIACGLFLLCWIMIVILEFLSWIFKNSSFHSTAAKIQYFLLMFQLFPAIVLIIFWMMKEGF